MIIRLKSTNGILILVIPDISCVNYFYSDSKILITLKNGLTQEIYNPNKQELADTFKELSKGIENYYKKWNK